MTRFNAPKPHQITSDWLVVDDNDDPEVDLVTSALHVDSEGRFHMGWTVSSAGVTLPEASDFLREGALAIQAWLLREGSGLVRDDPGEGDRE